MSKSTAPTLPVQAAPSDEDLRKRYEDEKQRFVQPEQRLVSHILINVPANATPDQQKAALAKAEKIAAEANPVRLCQARQGRIQRIWGPSVRAATWAGWRKA